MLYLQSQFFDYVCFQQVAAAAGLPEELVSKAKQSRSEKKARKAMSKLGKCVCIGGGGSVLVAVILI